MTDPRPTLRRIRDVYDCESPQFIALDAALVALEALARIEAWAESSEPDSWNCNELTRQARVDAKAHVRRLRHGSV
jgi:hypothetical protein